MRVPKLPPGVVLALSSALALSGCSKKPMATVDNQDLPKADTAAAKTVTVDGQVTAPEGLFDNQPLAKPAGMIDNWLNPSAMALSATVSLAGLSVGIWNSDAQGVAVGSPLAVTQTDSRGYYVLPMPVTYVASPAQVIRVGDEGFHLRRMVTGTAKQDVNLVTEVGTRVIVTQTTSYPVDIRFIPASQFQNVYTTVDHDFRDYDVRPIILKAKGPKKVVFQDTCAYLVNQVQARSTTFTVVRESVRSSYDMARRKGQGVLPAKAKDGARPAPPAKPQGNSNRADQPKGNRDRGDDRPKGSAGKPSGSAGKPSGSAGKPSGSAGKPSGNNGQGGGADKPKGNGGGQGKPQGNGNGPGNGAKKPQGNGNGPRGGADKPNGNGGGGRGGGGKKD